jgi:hypothetical protein
MEPEGSLPHFHKCPPTVSILSQPNPVHNPTSHLKSHVPLSLLRSYQNISLGPKLRLWIFRNKNSLLQWGVVSPSPNPQAGVPPLVSCPRLLFSYPPYWRTFLHPQPEDAPCRGDRDPLTTWMHLKMAIQKVTRNVRTVPRQSPDIYRHA